MHGGQADLDGSARACTVRSRTSAFESARGSNRARGDVDRETYVENILLCLLDIVIPRHTLYIVLVADLTVNSNLIVILVSKFLLVYRLYVKCTLGIVKNIFFIQIIMIYTFN